MAVLGKGQISQHFWWREFAQKARPGNGFPSPAPVPDELRHRVRALCVCILEPLRMRFGAPITIISGYRSPDYNRVIGGSVQSKHCLGEAADIRVQGFDADLVHETILDMHKAGELPHLGGLGLYTGWVHVDIRHDGKKRLARWQG